MMGGHQTRSQRRLRTVALYSFVLALAWLVLSPLIRLQAVSLP